MAKKISDLAAASTLAGAELFELVQGGANVKGTVSSLFQGGLRNLLINALGQIKQRSYTSGTATTAANQYTLDRWKVLTSGQNLSWTFNGAVATFTAPAGGVAQVVEGANIQGGNYVLSWTGTATVTVNGTAVTNGTPFNLPENTNATVVFSNGTFSMPQLEKGNFPTRFDWRNYAIELLLCQRYCWAGLPTAAGINTNVYAASCYQSFLCAFHVPMRAIPAVSVVNATAISYAASLDRTVGTNGIDVSGNGVDGFRILLKSNAADINMYVAWNTCYFLADAEL